MNIKHDKTTVLKTGLGLFCKRGYNSLGVDEICKTTGMTKGAFYNAFKSKEQFLIETIEVYGNANVDRINRELQAKEGVSPLQQLIAFYDYMIQVQPKSDYTGCFINNTMSELGYVSEAVGVATTHQFNRFLEAIEPTVKAAQQAGEITQAVSSNDITELLHSTFYGVLTRAKSAQDVEKGLNTMHLLINQLKTTSK